MPCHYGHLPPLGESAVPDKAPAQTDGSREASGGVWP